MTERRTLYYFQYTTTSGTVSLIPEKDGRYAIKFQDEHLGSYQTPGAAADDVSGGHTYSPSDGTDLGALGIPEDLGEWEKKIFA
ncbi:hypothetical protein [Thalassobaculum litoreum]|uniref:hypothetical protein n=1 Tax=Thalassobaculum litoreum TaxID=420996 RepID=UPI0011134B2E|nr:hypothetical protein [Thalassobaculum litoreum]